MKQILIAGAVVISMVASPVMGATTVEIQAQISALLNQIAALQAQLSSGAATTVCGTITSDLKVGSQGSEVTCLQRFLIAKGYLRAAATGYFGLLTKAAVAAWQASAGISSTGYVGPITRQQLNVSGGTSAGVTTSGNPLADPCSGMCTSREQCTKMSATGYGCVSMYDSGTTTIAPIAPTDPCTFAFVSRSCPVTNEAIVQTCTDGTAVYRHLSDGTVYRGSYCGNPTQGQDYSWYCANTALSADATVCPGGAQAGPRFVQSCGNGTAVYINDVSGQILHGNMCRSM